MINSPLLTVFTPTFNRADTLPQVYKSLLKQTSKNFVWQIIDDGSTDHTAKLVKKWIDEFKISIIYIKQENQGKTRAINHSVKMTETPLWVCLDSDDTFTESAVEKIENSFSLIDKKNNLCGMIALRSKSNGEPMQGKRIPESLMKTTQKYLRYQLNIPPEYVQVYKTTIIKKYPYPEISGETYFPLSFIQDQLDQKYEFHVIHDHLMYCDYQNDGITRNKIEQISNNPIGYMLFKKQLIELAPNLKIKIVSAVTYNSASILANKREPIRSVKDRWIVRILFPFGYLDYLLRFKLRLNIHFEKT